MSLHRIARYAGRPLLMTADAARLLAQRALSIDPRALQVPDRAIIRAPKTLLARFASTFSFADPLRPASFYEDDDDDAPPPRTTPAGYAPGYASAPEFEGFGWALVDGIACLNIEGALLDRGFYACGEMFWGYDSIAQAVGEAMAEPRVRGVFVRMQSPGGVVAGGLEALTADLRAWRASGNDNGKPIFVYADCAASAAYWIAAQADRIYAPAVGMAGSIGAVIVHQDISGALAQDGVKITAIQFGAKKTDGAWFKPLSEEAQADLQAEIDAIGARFVADVVEGRPQLSEAGLIATQAACFMAEHPEAARSALSLGLVDEIAREEDAFAALLAQVSARVTPVPVSKSAQRRAPAPATAAHAPAGAPQETHNMRKDQRARVSAVLTRAAMSDEEKLDAIRGIIDDAEEADAEEDEETVAEDEVEETKAEGEEEETTAEDEEEDADAEDDEDKVDAKAARAILALPHARGREQLAAELALTPGMTAATASKLLAASPKASRLADRVHDPDLGPAGDAARAPKSDDDKAAEFVRASAELARGQPAARRR